MDHFIRKNLDTLKQAGLYRSLKTVESEQGPEVIYQGRSYLNFSSNNYLGLANHPRLKKAAMEALEKFGTGSGASRLISGSMGLHEELEQAIASFKGTERALVFNSGYQANIGVLSSLMNEGDVIFSDSLNHASLIDGCRLSKAETKVYRHNDMEHLEELLRGSVGANDHLPLQKRLIIADTVFSMDGDLAPLPDIIQLAEKYEAWVFADEAHGTGVFGERGRGVVEHFGIDSRHHRLIQMGTLGKALGSFGAYVCGTHDFIDFLINRARSFIYTTSLPPAVLAASLEAFKLIGADLSFKENLWRNTSFFRKGLETILQNTSFSLASTQSPILPVLIGDSEQTMKISQALFEKGIWASGIRPPTVPEGTSRIRFTLMATHTEAHLTRCLEAFKEI